ncbi:hypothetical protein ES703_06351 [subsurface metagenome]
MPSPQQEKLLELLAGETGAVSAAELAKKAGIPNIEAVRTQLGRLAKEALVSKDAQGEWTLADEGREYLNQLTQETAGTSEYEIFKSLGRRIGVVGELIGVVAEHVWSGGDYEDVNWVWKALGEMDIRADQRKRWWNAWRSHLGKAIPPDLREEVVGKDGEEPGQAGAPKKSPNDYMIVEDEPVRVGEGLGDYSLQDAKDILAVRAIKSRFDRFNRPGTDGSGTGGTGEKISDIITALAPYLNKDTDPETVKEMLGDKLALLKQEIIMGLPHPSQQKSMVDQLSELGAILGTLKDSGPLLRSLLGIPEPSTSSNPSTTSSMPVQLSDKDGNPIVMDFDSLLNWKKFQGEEQRADEKQTLLRGMVTEFRQQLPVAMQALKATAEAYNRAAVSSKAEGIPQSAPIQVTCAGCQQLITLSEVPTVEFACPHCGVTLAPPVA